MPMSQLSIKGHTTYSHTILRFSVDDACYLLPFMMLKEKKSITIVNLTKSDPLGFTPFVKVTPDGREVWLVHKSADVITVISTQQPFNIISTIKLEKGSKPNHVEFAGGREDNGGGGGGDYAYVTLASADPK